jgi:signal transduction histidine kinase
MVRSFVKQLEKRPNIATLFSAYADIFDQGAGGEPVLSPEGFDGLVAFLSKGEPSLQNVAVQAAMRWSSPSQKVALRNLIARRGFLTSSCLWAYRELRGCPEDLFGDHDSPEMLFMQIVLMREVDAAKAVPFLIERFVTRRELPEELRSAARLCVLRLLDSRGTPEVVRWLQSRYPGVELLFQWRPAIPACQWGLGPGPKETSIDFHNLVRSVHDIKELSSLTRTIYLASLFYVPLTEKEWKSFWLSKYDPIFFKRLAAAGVVEPSDGGYILAADANKRALVQKFLFEKYSLAREAIGRNKAVRLKEDRERRVRNSELDRQALDMIPEGIICVDASGLYYMNEPAERILSQNNALKERLFGAAALDSALKDYSRESVLRRVANSIRESGSSAEVFGDRVAINTDGRRFEVDLGPQIIMLRDTTDRYLVEQEIGRLYRHELKAALDVIGAGLAAAKDLAAEGKHGEGCRLLGEVEDRRRELIAMLEDRLDFIRLHSDVFQISPSPVNLNLVLDRCLNNYREAAAAKGLEIESNHLEQDAVTVQGEERFLVRALDNIIRNSVKFSPKGAKIAVTLGFEGFESVVRVKDTGPGIPPENIGKIFRLGFTTGGAGRGLYLARRIIKAHRGRIEAHSAPGSGACFTVRLPASME